MTDPVLQGKTRNMHISTISIKTCKDSTISIAGDFNIGISISI